MLPFLPSVMGTSNRTALYIVAALCAVLIALLAGGWWGWTRGGASARNEMSAEYDRNLAQATREAMSKQASQQAYANGLAVELTNTKRTLEAERVTLRGRITHAASAVPADCAFGPAFVELWNQALGLPASGLPQAGSPGGAAGPTPAAPGAGAGLQQAVSPEDLLSHLIDYGQYCRTELARRDKLQAYVLEVSR